MAPSPPPLPRQRPICRCHHPPMLVGSLSVYLSFSGQLILYLVGERLPVERRWCGQRRNRSWRLGFGHAGSQGLLTHAGLRPAWVCRPTLGQEDPHRRVCMAGLSGNLSLQRGEVRW